MSSNVVTHEPTDVVVLGLGHMGGPVAAELSTAGYKVVGIEKGPYWDYATDWSPTNIHDEWAIMLERKFDHPLQLSTFTVRNDRDQVALPVRRYTKFVQYQALGHGVGGAGTHYGGVMGRFAPWSYKPYSETINKYGESVLPTNHDMEDFPVSYQDMVPYYEKWEKAMGISGTNQDPFIPGVKFPTPAHPTTPYGEVFRGAAESLGYHPYPQPSALISQPYTNQYGVSRNGCLYCGWCAGRCNYPCEVGAKGSSHVTTVPAAMKTGNFDLRLNSIVYRIDLDASGKKATGVRYYDPQGNINIQPAKVVFNGIWGFNLVRLMLLSGIGKPYDPVKISGSVGRAPTLGDGPAATSVSGTLNMATNTYSCGNQAGGGYVMLDLADDNFDHKGQNFIGGAPISYGNFLGAGPNMVTAFNPGKTSWGSAWKKGLKDMKLPSKLTVSFAPTGPEIPTKDQYVGLDPHYNDIYGDPVARVTINWGANRWRVADYLAPKLQEILTKMGCTDIKVNKVPELSSKPDLWAAHVRDGARTGSKPETSVFNKWMQSWDVENVFASGEICDPFGDNITPGTHPVGAMAYLAADGIQKYLKSPGPLVA
ncbi:MAG: GMC family oxidoreductase [Thaumarchaeota archaeon]|nr:GMC family oxidoreductase [Nitrososphaerota archaeon]MCL5318228.1 GMC family oxidoreductase [Nitrososphaerota archaeon]